MYREIDCNTCELHMDNFLERDVIDDELFDFLNHVLHCDDCYEELETRYLVSEVLSRLESGETIDLRRELVNKINGARKALKIHSFVENLYSSIEVIAAVMFIFAVLNALVRYL